MECAENGCPRRFPDSKGGITEKTFHKIIDHPVEDINGKEEEEDEY